MDMDEIERSLLDDRAEPRPSFQADVMRAVRREAATLPPIRFPWERLAVGAGGWLLVLALAWKAMVSSDPARLVTSAPAVAVACLAFSFVVQRALRVWAS